MTISRGHLLLHSKLHNSRPFSAFYGLLPTGPSMPRWYIRALVAVRCSPVQVACNQCTPVYPSADIKGSGLFTLLMGRIFGVEGLNWQKIAAVITR